MNNGVWDPVSKRSPHSKYNKCAKVSLLSGIICCIVTSLHLNKHVGYPSPLVPISCMDLFTAWVKSAAWGPIHFMFLPGELFPLEHCIHYICCKITLMGLPPPFTVFTTYAVKEHWWGCHHHSQHSLHMLYDLNFLLGVSLLHGVFFCT